MNEAEDKIVAIDRILVIDDDLAVRSMLKQTLEKAGYDVMVAADGAVGLRFFQLQQVDLIITDILMPEKDGWETIRDIRTHFPDAKIIAISGGRASGAYRYLTIARRLGADRIFTKPIEREKLLAAISELSGE